MLFRSGHMMIKYNHQRKGENDMKITKVEEKWEKNTNSYNWYFTIDDKEEVIISEENIDKILNDYYQRHTNFGR